MPPSGSAFQLAPWSVTPGVPDAGQYLLYVGPSNTLNLEDSLGNVFTFGSTNFISQLSGDVSAIGPGNAAATVVAIQGSAVSNVAPTDTQFLVWNAISGKYVAINIGGDATMTNTGAVTLLSTAVTGKLLTGLTTGTNTPIAATDSILIALEKLQAQISAEDSVAITALTGDGTATGPGSVFFTLATVNADVGSFGNQTTVAQFTVNDKGLITAAANVTIGNLTTSNLSASAGILGTQIAASTITGSNIANGTVANINLAQMPANTVKANTTGSPATPVDTALGTLTESTSSVLVLTGWIDATIGAPTIQVLQAGASQSGYLSSIDWNNFNNTFANAITALTGDVTATGPGSVTASIASTTVTGKLLTGYTSGTNTPIVATDSILTALEKLQAQISYAIPPANVVVVQKNPGTGQFSSIVSALASVTTASSSNPFLVYVYPGVYTEAQIAMKPYVYVLGAGLESVVIQPSNPSAHLVVGSDFSSIQSCVLTGVTGTGQALVYHNSLTGTTQTAFWVEDVRFGASDTLVISSGNNTGMSTVSINACRFGSVYSFNTGFYATTTGSNPGKIEIRDTTTTAMQSPYPADVFLADAANCEIVINGVQCRSGSVTSGNCIRARNGAILRISGLDLKGFGTGLFIENVGAGPTVAISIATFENNTHDLNIANAGVAGVINVAANRSNSTIVAGASSLALVILDTATGAINTSNMINIEQLDGTFTDATTIALDASPMGVLQTGTITVVSGLTVNVSAGFGYLDTTGSALIPGSIHRLNWPSTNITLAANSNNYLFFNSSAVLSVSSTFPDTAGNILLGRVVTNATGVLFIDLAPLISHHYGNTNDNFIREALGAVYSYGSIVTEDSLPLHLDVTSGSYFFGNNNFLPSSGINITFQSFYQDGSGGWNISSTNTVDTNSYDNGSGTLQPIPSGYYARHSMYLVGQGANQQYMLVYAQTTYPSLVLAQTGNIPTPPSYFEDGVVLIASIIVKQGSTSIVAGGGQIVDNRPRIGFSLPAVEAVGTVTSVAATVPSFLSVSGSPITSSGTLAITYSGTPLPFANGGTNNTTPYTAGSVVFSNGTSLTQDNSKFFWDDTNFALGVGQIPQAASVITTLNTTGAAKPIWQISYGVGSSTGLRGDFARGTIVSPAAAQSGDILNFISGRGYGATAPASASTGVMQIVADETFTNTSNATYIAFKTTPTGSVTSVEAMRINSTGHVLIDTTTDNGTDYLQIGSGLIAGYAKLAGSTSGYLNMTVPSTVSTYTLTWPSSQGAAGTFLCDTDGAGTLGWSNPNTNVDGGNPSSVYTPTQFINGGTP